MLDLIGSSKYISLHRICPRVLQQEVLSRPISIQVDDECALEFQALIYYVLHNC